VSIHGYGKNAANSQLFFGNFPNRSFSGTAGRMEIGRRFCLFSAFVSKYVDFSHKEFLAFSSALC